MRLYVYAAIALAVVTLATAALVKAYRAGESACEAEHAIAAQKAAAEVDRRDGASAQASTSMLDYLAATTPAAEAKTNATIERVRVVYRDHPVPAACQWPDSVRAELDQAIVRANAATR